MNQHQTKKRIFNAFDPTESLDPGDPRYVECNELRGSSLLLDAMENAIRLSNKNICHLLSGHRGCGKTTELFRLRERLTKGSAHFVAYCEADEYLDLNDAVEYTDVLLAVIQQISKDAAEQSISLEPGKFQKFLTDLWDILSSPVQFEDGKVTLGVLQLGFKFKHNPNYRQQVREYLRPRAADFLQAANEVIEKATREFKRSSANCEGLVVIVDNLDRLLRRSIPGANHTSHDELFINSANQLSALACHVIYTLPPALLHSPNGGKLAALYGNQPCMLPMIPVTTRTGDECRPGIEKLIEIVRRRLNFAKAKDAFNADATIERLCVVSGGYVRSLMTLVQQSVVFTTKALPVERDAVEQAIRALRDSFIRSLRPSHWPFLREVNTIHKLGESEQYLQLLDNLAVLEYLDEKGPRYDISPAIREAEEFKSQDNTDTVVIQEPLA